MFYTHTITTYHNTIVEETKDSIILPEVDEEVEEVDVAEGHVVADGMEVEEIKINILTTAPNRIMHSGDLVLYVMRWATLQELVHLSLQINSLRWKKVISPK